MTPCCGCRLLCQAPVRAAIHGRVLLIDGIERAERNVLPTLNNLLENREMGLDDGRFLVSPATYACFPAPQLCTTHGRMCMCFMRHGAHVCARYDALVAEGTSEEELARRKLVRVHPDFRVVALGLPVPPYPGKPLDPPLRHVAVPLCRAFANAPGCAHGPRGLRGRCGCSGLGSRGDTLGRHPQTRWCRGLPRQHPT